MYFFNDCGIGSDPNDSSPCTGTYGPNHDLASQSGGHAFDALSSGSIVLALIGAAALIAGLLFVRAMTRKVGGFFGGDGKVTHEWQDANFSKDAYRSRGGGPTSEWSFVDNPAAGYRAPSADEDDREDDSEDDSDADDEAERLEHRA